MQQQALACPNFEEIVYLFQGGGALGAFQVGVYQALREAGYMPNWMVGISIGAMNAAIIAGNPHAERMDRMYQFWDLITHNIEPLHLIHDEENVSYIQAYNHFSAMRALNFGQQNFFNTAGINPWLVQNKTPDHISFYNTDALIDSLKQVIDFDYLNAAHTRLSLGAVDIETGKLKFFDNTEQTITVDHIRASCALPPGFPAVEIDGRYYWDGGLYSNTPLIKVINDKPLKNRLCFLIDLFDSTGLLPSNMDEVLERAKDITYSGHMDLLLDYYDLQLMMQKRIAKTCNKLPREIAMQPYIKELFKLGDDHNVHLTKIVYKAHKNEMHSKDYEFSDFSARRRIVEGYRYTKELVSDPQWWRKRETNLGNIVHKTPHDCHIVIGDCICKK